jgi:hypothetical protein
MPDFIQKQTDERGLADLSRALARSSTLPCPKRSRKRAVWRRLISYFVRVAK